MREARRLSLLANHLTPRAAADDESLTVLVTGCTSGLGLNLTREFARLGHTVIGVGRRKERIEALQAELGPKCKFRVLDTSDVDAVTAFAKNIIDNFNVDVLINNAGVSAGRYLTWELDVADFDRVLDVNVRGVFHMCKAFIPSMLGSYITSGKQRKKAVINISSGLGHSTSPVAGAYCTSKWAVESLSKSIAQGFNALGLNSAGDAGMLCVPLAPGVIRTEMNKNKAMPSAEEWCKSAAPFILSIPSTENGSSLTVPTFYSQVYMDTWVIPNGLKLPGNVVSPQ